MNIDLLEIYENNKKIEKEQEKVNKEKELRRLLSYIIKDEEEWQTDNKELLEEMQVKYKEKKYETRGFYPFGKIMENYKYDVKLTKENIKKINAYLKKVD